MGEYIVYESRAGGYEGYVLAKELRLDNDTELGEVRKVLNRRKMLRADYLTDFITFFEKVETDWCSKYFRIWVVYEYSPLTLEKELWDRLKLSQGTRNSKVRFFKNCVFLNTEQFFS